MKIPGFLDIVGFCAGLSICKRIQRGAHHILLGGLVAISILTHLLHGNAVRVTVTLAMFIKIVILYLMTVNSITSPARLRAFFVFLSIIAAMLSINALGQLRIAPGFGEVPAYQTSFVGNSVPLIRTVEKKGAGGEVVREYTPQITGIGIFNDPNDLGQMLSFGVILSLGLLYFYPAYFFYWGFSPVIMLICLVGIYYTNSRGTFVAMAGGLAYFFMRNTEKIYPKVLGGIFMALLFVLGPSRMSQVSASEGTDRLELWSAALDLFRQHPLMGVGVGNFTDAAEMGKTAHQSYLLALSEMGILGFFFWFGLIIFFWNISGKIRLLLATPKSAYETDVLKLLKIAEAALACFLISAYFLSRTYQFPFFVLLALGPALGVMVKREYPDFTLRLSNDEWYKFASITVGFIVFLYFATTLLWRMA